MPQPWIRAAAEEKDRAAAPGGTPAGAGGEETGKQGRELNPLPPGYEPGALPMRHPATETEDPMRKTITAALLALVAACSAPHDAATELAARANEIRQEIRAIEAAQQRRASALRADLYELPEDARLAYLRAWQATDSLIRQSEGRLLADLRAHEEELHAQRRRMGF